MISNNMFNFHKKRQQGVSLIEVLITVAILATLLVTVSLGVTQMVYNRSALLSNTVALYLAEEGYEMVRTVRDDDWDEIDTLTTGVTYYLDVTPTDIVIVTTPVLIDTTYTRSFVLSDVSRNSDDDIVSNGTAGASVDSNAREVTVTVVGGSSAQVFTGLITKIYAI